MIKTAAEAERLAAEGEAIRRDRGPRRSNLNYFPDYACDEEYDEQFEQDEGPLDE